MPKAKVSKAFNDKRKNVGNSRTFKQKQASKRKNVGNSRTFKQKQASKKKKK